jgi:hypothetical protein
MDDRQGIKTHRVAKGKIVANYAVFGVAWIYGSDAVLGWDAQDAGAPDR